MLPYMPSPRIIFRFAQEPVAHSGEYFNVGNYTGGTGAGGAVWGVTQFGTKPQFSEEDTSLQFWAGQLVGCQ